MHMICAKPLPVIEFQNRFAHLGNVTEYSQHFSTECENRESRVNQRLEFQHGF